MDPQLTQLADLLLKTLDVNADVRRAGARARRRVGQRARAHACCAPPPTPPPPSLPLLASAPSPALAATSALSSAERSPQYAPSLLSLSRADAFDLKIRLLAATCFKNHVRRHWGEAEPDVIPAAERASIKSHLVELMCAVPPLVQRQLSEALSLVSRRDFPDEWPSLLGELVARLSSPDMAVVAGVLEAAASIFERFRTAPNTDPVRLQVRYSLDNFAAPLLATLGALVAALDAASAQGCGRAVLVPVLTSLRLVVSIFHSLAWLELPDVFEDKIAEWMTCFQKFLTCV